MIFPENFEHKVGFDGVRSSIASFCLTPEGLRQCADIAFSSDYDDVVTALRSVDELISYTSEKGERLPISTCGDIHSLIASIKVPGSYIETKEMVAVQSFMKMLDELKRYLAQSDEGDNRKIINLMAIVGDIATFPKLVADIDRVVDRHGQIKDRASDVLFEIRRSLNSLAGSANSALRRVLGRAISEGLVEADATPTMRDGRLVIPVAPMNKRKINGIVHDESATGKTVFIEPAEVVAVNNQIRELQIEERREITRILILLSDNLREHYDELLLAYKQLGTLDFIHAKAEYAATIDAHMPSVSESPEIEWYHACHPGLLTTLRNQGKDVVPLDIKLDGKNRILIISGPNAGGKSVCLKTVGVVQYMLQCGVLPPVYENSRFGIFESIFVDIGDDQSIEDDLSTYSSHLRNMKMLLSRGNNRSLFLIDEFGSGTEPQIGAALAQAILLKFNDKGMWGVVTTHFQNLKQIAEDTPGLINGSMIYDRHLMQPTFRLSIGSPGSSFAVEIARKIGLPVEIIEEAEKIVGSDYINMDRYLLDIARDKKYWENKRAEIRKKEKRIEETLAKYEQDADTLRQKRREILDEARQEASKIIQESNATIERTIHEIRRTQADKEKTKAAREKLKSEQTKIASTATSDNELLRKAPKKRKSSSNATAPKSTGDIAVGDYVKLDGQGTAGQVESISGSNAVVIFGSLRTTVAINRLTRTAQQKSKPRASSFVSTATSDDMRRRQLNFSQDIDVRGMRVDEALQAITYFIDDAIQFSAQRVRILHGTGTGALRQALRQYLSTVPGVSSFRDEHVQLGGAGITIVDLK